MAPSALLDVCLKENMTLADRMYNLQLIQDFCKDNLSNCCHFSLEDMLYASSTIKVLLRPAACFITLLHVSIYVWLGAKMTVFMQIEKGFRDFYWIQGIILHTKYAYIILEIKFNNLFFINSSLWKSMYIGVLASHDNYKQFLIMWNKKCAKCHRIEHSDYTYVQYCDTDHIWLVSRGSLCKPNLHCEIVFMIIL